MKIVLTGGGTGGHIYPGLAIAEALAADAACAPLEVLFVGTRDRLEAQIVPKAGVPIAFVHAAPLSRVFSARDPFAIVRTLALGAAGFFESLSVLHRARPDVLIATGGYVALPVVAALRFVRFLRRTRAKTALLEPNAVAGITNRLLAPLVDEVWYALAPARSLRGNERVVGMPVRSSMRRPLDAAAARASLGLAPERKTIVVMGGSQGAASINEAFASLVQTGVPADWQFLAIAGARDYTALGARLAPFPAATVVPYLDDPRPAFAAADLVVARAGASTLGELAATATPALLIPYPYATGDHQRRNAERYAASAAARVLFDRDLSAARLRAELVEMLGEPVLRELRDAARSLADVDPRATIVARVKALSASNRGLP
ncbi:MAG: UDP-N-acetylglucosamine--N-acetylmuramyl-(pentapeptide) pyrophosphoryl-undecaprenol N-acetylglucosamine transferase [Candidatus Eremiobacteraeota bacterium]|nr:UDP-N-acetylglucosamine--N-acetylmuramyl-(pentapeptide) pyrophosphoryl-undecaprenol N-acetylglucosamine transferase [Candidatus Eremiobacteraeota bacterium]